MLGYVTLGTNDNAGSVAFYGAVLIPLGMKRKFAQEGGWAGYGLPETPDADVEICVCPPFDGQPATYGNGTMIALRAISMDSVDAAYNGGMANGGTSEGAPGFRPPESEHFYGAYLRDPTGNKLCIFCLV